ncbi:hypothetical protein TNCV_3422321 [Trichonephila clavipes]|nr:hypothetical protein TNCV_3422321 [Trichonephila clavipes]
MRGGIRISDTNLAPSPGDDKSLGISSHRIGLSKSSCTFSVPEKYTSVPSTLLTLLSYKLNFVGRQCEGALLPDYQRELEV